MEYVKVFLIGGAICAAVQFLMEKTKLMPGRIMVLLVCSGVRLARLEFMDRLLNLPAPGASVPLIGFGHSLWLGVKEAITNEGFIGIFKGGFSASAIGISASLLLGYIASLIFNPKADV